MCYLRTSRQWVDYSALVTDGDAAPHDQSTEGQSGSIHPPPPPPSPTLDWCARGRAVCCDCRCSSSFRRSSGPTVTAVGTVAQFRSVRPSIDRSPGHPAPPVRLTFTAHAMHAPTGCHTYARAGSSRSRGVECCCCTVAAPCRWRRRSSGAVPTSPLGAVQPLAVALT